MNIVTAFQTLRRAAHIKKTVSKAEEVEFRQRRSSMLGEKSITQQLHKELSEQLNFMENHDPPVKAALIRIAPEHVTFLSVAQQG